MSEDSGKCCFCGANLQGRPYCKICGCEVDYTTEEAEQVRTIHLSSTLARAIRLPIFVEGKPQPSKPPRLLSVGPNLEVVE